MWSRSDKVLFDPIWSRRSESYGRAHYESIDTAEGFYHCLDTWDIMMKCWLEVEDMSRLPGLGIITPVLTAALQEFESTH